MEYVTNQSPTDDSAITFYHIADELHAKCVCGSQVLATPGQLRRFRERHPSKCREKARNREFTKSLAAGVRCVDDDARQVVSEDL